MNGVRKDDIDMGHEDAFREVADLLFGSGADELIHKMNPEGHDLSAKRKKERTQARVGLATNIIGLGAGAVATPPAFKAVKQARADLKANDYDPKHARKSRRAPGPAKTKGFLQPISDAGHKLQSATGTKKAAVVLAGAGAGLQVANLGGDFIANRVLSREAKKNPDVKGGSGTLYRKTKKKVEEKVHKSEAFDVTWEGEISKIDTDKRQVFGWASIVEMNGEPVVDLQGDYISIEEIEKSAYEYVVKSRKGGDMHKRVGEEPLHASDMIESFLVTPEKISKMGLPEGSLPVGWWVGYQVNNDDLWAEVKSGKRTGFSIHGRGQRSPA